MILNHPTHDRINRLNHHILENARTITESMRNIERLVAYNNRRILRGLRPLEVPIKLINASHQVLDIAAAVDSQQ